MQDDGTVTSDQADYTPDETVDDTTEAPVAEAPVSEEDFQSEALGPGTPGSAQDQTSLTVPAAQSTALTSRDVPESIDRAYQTDKAVSSEQAKVGDALTAEREAKQTERENAANSARDIANQERLDLLESQDVTNQHREALDEANKQLNGYEQAVANHKYHDFWGNKSTGNKVLAVLFSSLGGGASAVTKQPNAALAEIDHAEQMDYQKQRDELLNKEKFVEWKRAGVKDMEGQFDKEQARLKVEQSKRLDSIAQYAKSELVKRGASPEEAQNNVVVAGLTAKAEKSRSDALMKMYAAELKKKKSGAGGGTFNPNADAMLAQMATDSKTSPSELARFMAERYKTPKEYTRAMNLVKEERANVAKGITEGTQSERAVRQDVTQWMVANDWTKKAKAHDELSKLENKLKGNPDPITVASALMELDVAARGGTATGASMSMFQSHLGGTMEKLRGMIEQGKTGNLSEGQIKTVRTALAAAEKAAQEEGTEARKSFDAEFGDVPAAKRRADSMFSRYGGTTVEADKAATGRANNASASHPQDSEALKWAKANMSDPRAKKILELNGGK